MGTIGGVTHLYACVAAIALFAAIGAAPPQDRPDRRITIPALVSAVAFAPDGETIVAWDPGGFSRWNIQRGRMTQREQVFAKACGRAAVLPRSDDGRTIGANCKGKLVLFEVATARALGEWQSAQKRIPVVFTASPDGRLVATVMAGALSTVDVADQKGAAAAPPLDNQQEVELLTFSSSASHLGVGSVGSVKLWGLPGGRLLHSINGGPAHTFHPDGSSVAAVQDGAAALFAVADGTRIRSFEGAASQLRFSSDGRWVIGWTNQQVIIWETATGKQRLVLKGHEFVGVAMSADGARIATISLERRGEAAASLVEIWRLP